MTTFIAGSAFDTTLFINSGSIGELFELGTAVTATETLFELEYSDETTDERLTLAGSFADYVDGFPTTGTISAITYTLDGVTVFTFTGVSMTVAQFTAFVDADDIGSLFQALLAGADQVNGSAGDDSLLGYAGNDTMNGGSGNDLLDGGAGSDNLDGGAGDDTLVVSTPPVAGDVFNGAEGIDTLRVETSAGAVVNTLNGTVSRVSMFGTTLTSIERLDFASSAGTGVNVTMLASQIGTGLSPTAQLIGGAGIDQLTIVVTVPGTYTAPSFTYLNWSPPSDPMTPGDSVLIVASGAGNYTLNAAVGHVGAQILIGGAGNDTLNGTDGTEVLGGGGGVNILNAGAGEDVLLAVNSTPFGGAQTFFNFAGNQYNGGDGFDYLSVGGFVDFQGTLSSIEGITFQNAFTATAPGTQSQNSAELLLSAANLATLPANLTLRGNGLLSVELGNANVDASQWVHVEGSQVLTEFFGDNGSQTMVGSSGSNRFSGGFGSDTFTGGAGADVFEAGEGQHVVTDFALAEDRVDLRDMNFTSLEQLLPYLSQAGNDVVFSRLFGGVAQTMTLRNVLIDDLTAANFLFQTANENDTRIGTELDDELIGAGGNDILEGLGGNDILVAGDGDDTLRGGLGSDQLYGGAGNDFLSEASGNNGPFGNDLYDGGDGNDRVSMFTEFGPGVTIDLNVTTAQNTGSMGTDTFVGIEHITANYGNDTLTGNDAANWFWTFSGTDSLAGNGGNDYFTVGQGDKVADGGTGADTIEVSDTAFVPAYTAAGITVSLALQGTAQATGIGNWTLTNMENLGGSFGADRLTGDDNANILAGAEGDDTLIGGAGNDTLAGDGTFGLDESKAPTFLSDPNWVDGNDYLDGGAGADMMIGGGGNDVYVIDQAGNAEVAGDSAIEAIDGGIDEIRTSLDWGLYGTNVENITATGTTNNFLGGSEVANVMTGNVGDNYIVGEGGNDTIDGGTGRDIASFGLPAGTIGNFVLVEGTGADAGLLLIQLVDGDNIQTVARVTLTGNGSATIEGVGAGAVWGTDTVTNIEELHFLEHTTDGSNATNLVVMNIAVQQYGDFLSGTDGNDVIDLANYSGVLHVNGNRGNDTIFGSAGNDGISGGLGNDVLRGGDGNDNVDGQEGDDTIEGGAGDDYIIGRAGNDMIDGGTGTNDVISFQLPEGTTGTMRVVQGTGSDSGNLLVELVNGGVAELIFRVTITPDRTFVQGLNSAAFLGTDTVSNFDQLHLFVNNAVFNPDQFVQINAPQVGTAGDDVLQGNFGADTLLGADGNDTLRGVGGNDVLVGGNGNDFLVGGAGDDRHDGGAGSDRVSLFDGSGTVGITIDLTLENVVQSTYAGNDIFVGIEHVTATYGNDQINGNDAANWFWTFSGTDTLNGNGGNDYFTVGTGTKTVDGGTGIDSLELADFATIPFYDPAIGFTVSLALQGAAQSTNVGDWTISNIENLGGWTGNDRLTGDDNANILAGQIGDDVLTGGAGNDTLVGDGTFRQGPGGSWELVEQATDSPHGNDYLDGGAGGDRMVGGGGNDVYVIDLAGSAEVAGDSVIEAVDGGTDEIRTSLDWGLFGTNVENITATGTTNNFLGGSEVANVMTGNVGNNYIVGEGGNDTIDGGAGRDVASFGLPAGTVGNFVLVEGTGPDAGLLLIQLVDGANVQTVARVTLTGNGSATIEGVGAGVVWGTDTVTNIEELHFLEHTTDGSNATNLVVLNLATQAFGDFVGGSEGDDVIDLADYPGAINSNGNRGDDLVIGTDAANNLSGGLGNDVLQGLVGNDSLNGNEGDDTLEGGAGDDYMVGGEGNDTIDGGTGVNDFASFQLPAGTPGTITVVDGVGDDAGKLLVQITNAGVTQTFLRVTVTGLGGAIVEGVGIGAFMGTDTVSNSNQLHIFVNTPGGAGPGQFVGINLTPMQFGNFVAGSESADVIDLADFAGAINANGNRGDDTITGTDVANNLQGGVGNDTLIGGAGGDVLNGQFGDDTLDGGLDIDTLIGGAGSDTITGGDGDDTLIGGFNTGFGAQPGDSADILRGEAGNDLIRGGDGDDVLEGGDGNDNLRGDAGSDVMHGGAGEDFVSYFYSALGSGITFDARTVGATATSTLADPLGGTDTLIDIEKLGIGGTEFDDTIYGSEHLAPTVGYANQMGGNGGNDHIHGAGFVDRIDGGTGNDTLWGYAGDDLMVGGAGNDLIDGGTGTLDRALFSITGSATATLSVVDGTGAYAGGKVVVLTDGEQTQIVAAITSVGGNIIVTGLGAAAEIGTDTLVNVEELVFETATSAVTLATGEGIVVDGLIAGATVFMDANENGQWDQGEARTTTGADGNFVFISPGSGPIVAIGGINTDTGLPNQIALTAPNGGGLVNPLTTLIQSVINASTVAITAEEAATQVATALGISSGIDLLSTDVFALAASGDSDALLAQKAAAIIVNLIVAAEDASATAGAGASVMDGLATLVVESTTGVSLTDEATIAQALSSALTEAQVEALSSTLASSAQAMTNATSLETLSVAQADALTTGNDLDNQLFGGDRNDNLRGLGGVDILSGGDGDDVIDGGNGIDTALYDGASAGVTVDLRLTAQVTGGAGNDTLTEIENLTGSSFGDRLIGNALANVLAGAAGSDTLDGGAGDDVMLGGAGDDYFIVDSAGDVITEGASEGFDTAFVRTGFALAAGSEVEALRAADPVATAALNLTGNEFGQILSGSNGANRLFGLAGDDYLEGRGGIDTLDGGIGADTMRGGTGDDYYIVDNIGDRMLEAAGEGFDTVFTNSSAAIEAGSEVEALRATNAASTTAMDLYGNEYGQVIAGNAGVNKLYGFAGDDYLEARAGSDTLDGGAGADTLIGGTGDDYYAVDSQLDRVIENDGEGFDTIFTSASLALNAQVSIEALRAIATPGVALDLQGNGFGQILAGNDESNRIYGLGGDDYLEGNGGIDTLDGGTGGDTMRGGTGDDYYIIDNSGDRILENGGEGFDTAFVDASFSLEEGQEVEALRASDANSTARMDLWGNQFGQVIQGTAGVNLLVGYGGDDYLEARGGDDKLDGGTGNDVLIGGTGVDIFAFGETGYTDRIIDFVSGTDRIDLRGIDAIAGTAGDQAFTWLGANAFTNVAGQLRSYSSGGVNYLAGDVDGNGIADFLIDLGSAQVQAPDILL